MNELETRFYECRFEQNSRKVSGYGIVFYDGTAGTEYQLAPNLYERMHPNAFDKSIQAGGVKMCLMHQRKDIIARQPKTLQFKKDSKGWVFEAEIIQTRNGDDALAMLQNDVLRGSSPGFYVRNKQYLKDGKKDIVLITEADLVEVSLVDDAAYASTTAAIREFEDWRKNQIESYEEKINFMLNRGKS